MRNRAPRILNDPVNCIDSSFIQTGTPTAFRKPPAKIRLGFGGRGQLRNRSGFPNQFIHKIPPRSSRQNRGNLRHRFHLHPLHRRVRPAAGRTHDHRLDPRGLQQRRVHPRRIAHIIRLASQYLPRRSIERPHNRRVPRDFKRIAHEIRPARSRANVGSAARNCSTIVPQFAPPLVPRSRPASFAVRSAICRMPRRCSIPRRPGSSPRAATAAPPADAATRPQQSAFQNFQPRQKPSHPHIRVDALLEPAAMRRAAFGFDFDPQISFVRQTNLHRRRLGHNRRVGLRDDGSHPPSRGCRILHPPPPRSPHRRAASRRNRLQRLHRRHLRRQAPFHVVAAASEHFSIANRRGKWLLHAFTPTVS